MSKVEKYVRIFAFDPLYRRIPFIFTVPRNAQGQFVTGQQDILNEKQMFGEEPITEKQKELLQMGDNPYIINPDHTYALFNGRRFDLSYVEENGKRVYLNPKDYAEYNFFILQPEVTMDKNDRREHVHFFYVEDREREAEKVITQEELQFEAMSFVKKNATAKRLREIALLMTHILPDVHIDPDHMSLTQIQAVLYELCRTNPEEVLMCRDSNAVDELNQEKLFVLKAIQVGEIVKIGTSYYFGKKGQKYIGDTFDSIVRWVRDKENDAAVQRIGAKIAEYDKKLAK